MSIKPLDTLLAIKVINLMPGLRPSERRVAATLIEHFNRKTGRCDPGTNRLADLLGLSIRTIIRATQNLETVGLILKVRHGGYSNRNRYAPNWVRFAELEQAWRDKLAEKARARRTKMSLATRQECHLGGDTAVTQTCTTNLQKQETYSHGRPSEVIGKAQNAAVRLPVRSGTRSADAARTEAERRWSGDLHAKFGSMQITYAQAIEAITPEIQSAATDVEMKKRGAGISYIIKQLRLE